MIKGIFVVAILVTLGWLGSFYYRRYEIDGIKKGLHTQIAALRIYEEAHALRHEHYVLVPDSCKAPGDPAWERLGMEAPSKIKGCFRVESRPTSYALAATATTSTSIQIIAVSLDGKIRGSETQDDEAPRWTAPDGTPLTD